MVKLIEKSKLKLVCGGGLPGPNSEDMLKASLLNSLKRQGTYTSNSIMVLETEDEVDSFIDFFIEKTGNKKLANTLKPIILANNGVYYYANRDEFIAFCDYLEKHERF